MTPYRRRGTAAKILVLLAGALVIAGIALATAGPGLSGGAVRSPAENPKVRALVRILAVFRRPQTATDRRPELFAGSSGAGLTPVRSLQRLAVTTSWGAKVYLVPLVKTSAHGLPLNPARGGLGMSINGRGGGCCDTANQVSAGRSYGNSVHPRGLIMVVPDGVARVSVALAARAGQSAPPVVTGAVRSNVAALWLKYDIMAGAGDLITWYSASGAVIKAFHPAA